MLTNGNNLVAIIYNGCTMCDKNDRTMVVAKYILQHLTLRIGIKGTGSLIQKHDTSWAKQGTSNSDALSLSLAQSPTLF